MDRPIPRYRHAARSEHTPSSTTRVASCFLCPGLTIFLRSQSPRRFFNHESASIFFSSVFSFSSSFSRRASGISIRPSLRFQRWNVCSEMFFSPHSSTMLLPPSASRKMRIFSSVVCLLPSMVYGPFRLPRLTPAPAPLQAVTSLHQVCCQSLRKSERHYIVESRRTSARSPRSQELQNAGEAGP